MGSYYMLCSINSRICSFNTHLLNIYYMADAVLGAVDTAINRHKAFSHGTYISSGRRQTNEQVYKR